LGQALLFFPTSLEEVDDEWLLGLAQMEAIFCVHVVRVISIPVTSQIVDSIYIWREDLWLIFLDAYVMLHHPSVDGTSGLPDNTQRAHCTHLEF
jgi:hypothetical protein